MRAWMALISASLLMAGCADVGPEPWSDVEDSDGDGFVDAVEAAHGSDPHNATSVPDVMVHEDLAWDDVATGLVGNGVPGVQCPATAASSKMLTWTIEAPDGVTDVHVVDMEVTITSPATMNDADVFIYSPSGDVIGSATSGAASETATAGKQDAVGEYAIEVRACSGTGDVEVVGTAVLGWTPSTEELLAADDGQQH